MPRHPRPLVIHRYPQRECPLPHKTWSGDFEELKSSSVADIHRFINTHTGDYLILFCEHTPVMDEYLVTRDIRGDANRARQAIVAYFQKGEDIERSEEEPPEKVTRLHFARGKGRWV